MDKPPPATGKIPRESESAELSVQGSMFALLFSQGPGAWQGSSASEELFKSLPGRATLAPGQTDSTDRALPQPPSQPAPAPPRHRSSQGRGSPRTRRDLNSLPGGSRPLTPEPPRGVVRAGRSHRGAARVPPAPRPRRPRRQEVPPASTEETRSRRPARERAPALHRLRSRLSRWARRPPSPPRPVCAAPSPARTA